MDPSGLPGLTISSGVPGSAAKPDAAIRIDRPKVCVQLRKLVQDNFDKHLYDSAVFFADKLVSMSSGNRDDVFLLATAYYRSGQYRRAVNLLKKNDLLEQKLSSLPFQFLAAQCLAKKEQWEECVTILEEALPEESERVVDIAAQIPHKHSEEVHSVAAMCQLRATAYHALDNRERAAEWYKNALKVDYFCMEAFAQLIDKQILPSSYEEELMTSLNFRPEDEWLKLLYASRLKKYGQDLEKKFAALESEEVALGGNLEVIATKAEAYYYLHDAQKAYDLTTYVRKEDPCQMACMPVHLSALVDLHLNSELFYCAHTLVESNPEAAITWFAVGCYYLLVHKYDAAQRYFHKATTMDSQV
jgi:anaphase-promoting complex subunit 6